MTSDSDALEKIEDGKPVRIFLPVKGGYRVRALCVYQETSPPKFSLLFRPGVLEVDEIDVKNSCIVSIDIGGQNLSLEAMITKIVNSQTLEMVIQKSMSHEQMREFFRVDAETQVIMSSFHTELRRGQEEEWSLQGQTIDISGSGILAVFDEQPPADKQVMLEITVPTSTPQTISVLAHPVRQKQETDGRYEVAYHFVDIATKDRDTIIGCCLALQRKMLQLKVQIKGN